MRKYLIILSLLFATPLLAQDDRAIDALLLDANYSAALSLIDTKLNTTSDQSRILTLENKKAETLIRLGKFDEAEILLKSTESKAANQKFQLAINQTNFGLLYMNLGRYDLANDALQKALINFSEDGQAESIEAAQALANLGNLYRATGKYEQAEQHLTMALNYKQKKLEANHELIAASYNDLGLVYSLTNPDRSLDYYEKALTIYQNLHGKDHPKIAIANTNIGFVYRQLELYGDAVINFESALAIWEKTYPQPHPAKAFTLYNLGETYLKIGDHKTAAGYYDKARKMYEACYGKKHPELARVMNAIGNLHFGEHDYETALQFYQQALHANVSDFNNTDILSNPGFKNYYDGNVLLQSMAYKAEALEKRHYNKTLKFNDLEVAIQTLERCDSLIDQMRQQTTNENDKITLGVIANEVYADGVRLASETGAVALKKRPYQEKAFYFAEKSKSAVLLEAITDANAKSFTGIPQDLLEEENELKAAIALCAQKLAQKPSDEEEKVLRETSFNLNRTYETFTKKLESQYPDYYNLKFNETLPSVPELQTRLDDETALLSYFIDDQNNRLYIFQITHSRFRITEHTLPQGFDRLISGMRNGLFYNDMSIYVKTSTELSALLIPQHIPSSIKKLTIIPTGRMSILPFETLLTETKKVKADQNLPYLIRKYSLQYEFSAGLLLQKRNQIKHTPSILLCAPVTFPKQKNLDELPATETEVEEIADLFASKKFHNTVYLRQQANEDSVKSGQAKNFSYLHFATHGVVDEESPELSNILLRSTESEEDGKLYTGEIYNLQLDANLVTLSACQTGLGKISKGEGVIGLSRALIYAGAQNIMVSYWSVSDASTAIVMKSFYSESLEHPEMDFSENLRQAKLEMIAHKTYSAPYYWAPFILIGSD